MKRLSRVVFIVVACVSSIAMTVSWAQATTFTLFDWGFNVNGTTFCSLGPCDNEGINPQDLPSLFPIGSSIDISQFDFDSGLGTLTITLQGSGPQTFVAFFDHDIDQAVNGSFNEIGTVHGRRASGQSWEIDEPDFSTGDIFVNFRQGTLDNGIGVPGTPFPGEVSMAMGFTVDLGSNGSETIVLLLGTQRPARGFFLAQTDPDLPDNPTVYLARSQTAAVPEPAASLLLSTGVIVLLLLGGKPIFRHA